MPYWIPEEGEIPEKYLGQEEQQFQEEQLGKEEIVSSKEAKALANKAKEEGRNVELYEGMFNVSSRELMGNRDWWTLYYPDEVASSKQWSEYRTYYDNPVSGETQYSDWTTDKTPATMSGTWYRQAATGNAEYAQKAQFYEQQLQKGQIECSKYRGAQFNICMEAIAQKIQGQMQRSIPGFASGGLVSTAPADVRQTKETTMMNRNMYPQGYAEGGNVMPMMEEEMPGLMEPPMPPMPEEEMMEQEQATMLEGILEPEEMDLLATVVEQFPELIPVLDKIDMAVGSSGEFDGEGPVSGPGTETSDSIPARLSDGEFVFTAKAVKQIGVDKLRKMMDKAESEYDATMMKQEEMQGLLGPGYAMGGLISAVADMRKQAADMGSAVTEYQQPALMQKSQNVDGAGRQMPQNQTGILAQKEVDLREQERSIRPRVELNTNQQSMGQASTTVAANAPRASFETEMGRSNMRENLINAAEENKEPSLMMV